MTNLVFETRIITLQQYMADISYASIDALLADFGVVAKTYASTTAYTPEGEMVDRCFAPIVSTPAEAIGYTITTILSHT